MIYLRLLKKQPVNRISLFILVVPQPLLKMFVAKKRSNLVYNELDSDQINGVPDEKLYRNVDLFVINTAQANPLLKSVIVIPSLIYGIGTELFDRASFQLPLLIRTALKRGKVETIGPGEATWGSVPIGDIVSPYLTTGREGYYFTENGRNSMRQIAEKIAEVLHRKGFIDSTHVASFPDAELESALFGPISWILFGGQGNSKAERSRKLGWNAHRLDVLDSFPSFPM
jgi:hypothetical protein